MADTWAEHLQALGLAELEALAQSTYYRIRAANSYQFDLEYTGAWPSTAGQESGSGLLPVSKMLGHI